MARKKFVLPKRCPYCAHKLRADGTCQNPECVIGYVAEEDTSETKETPKTSDAESK